MGQASTATSTAAKNAGIHSDAVLPALTGLRFVAALAVILSHFTEQGVALSPAWLIRDLDGGRPAVSLFFVLSGFILTFNYYNLTGRTDRFRFYVARIARIFPVLLLSLLIAAVGVTYAYSHRNDGLLLRWYGIEGHAGAKLSASLAAQLTATTGWFPTASVNQAWNGAAWSISCELFFYALFPAILIVAKRMRGRSLATLVIALWGLQQLWIVAARRLPVGQRDFVIGQFPVTHLFEFVFGVALAVWFVNGGRSVLSGNRSLRYALTAGATAAIVALSVWNPVSPAYYLLSPLFGAVILGLAASPKGSVLGWGPVVLLGEASYALYMIHLPILYIVQIWHVNGWLGWLTMLAVIGLSVVVFTWFETPARRRIRRMATRSRTIKPEYVTAS